MSIEKQIIEIIKKVVKRNDVVDTTATVIRTEGNTAWVHLDGGYDETPVSMTMNCSKGDSVRVRIKDGEAYIAGNPTSPPTDDSTANVAVRQSSSALESANIASKNAMAAQESAMAASSAAAQAISDAADAATAAGNAQSAATAAGNAAAQAQSDATAAGNAASAAASAASIADGKAVAAGNSAAAAANAASVADGKAVAAGNAAAAAQSSANAAQASADNAGEYASRALGNLSTVQSVAETLTWITQHGTMTLTTDTALDPTHVYFVVDANGDYIVGGTHYSVVTEPDVADIGTYYELNIDESLNNYVATHLALDSEGLWIIPVAGGFKVLIATGAGSTYTTAGTYIIDENGNAVGQFTTGAITLGSRASGSTVGLGSQVFGKNCVASQSYANAQGYETEASGFYSTALGLRTTASGNLAAYAEGRDTVASGSHAHAQGYGSVASGGSSFAGGFHTIAGYNDQTTLGKYNDNKSDTLFEIGNGTADDARSNAFEVYDNGRFGTPGLWFSVNASGIPCMSYEDGN